MSIIVFPRSGPFTLTIYISSGRAKQNDLLDFKWKGVRTPRVSIPAKKSRYLDAFNILHNSQETANLAVNYDIIDYTGYYKDYTLTGPGTFELDFVVFSDNFSPVHTSFILELASILDNTNFYTKEECDNIC